MHHTSQGDQMYEPFFPSKLNKYLDMCRMQYGGDGGYRGEGGEGGEG